MTTLITDIRVVLTAPEGINLVVVKVETNQPGLYGWGRPTFAYRHLAVVTLIQQYLKPLPVGPHPTPLQQPLPLIHPNPSWPIGPT